MASSGSDAGPGNGKRQLRLRPEGSEVVPSVLISPTANELRTTKFTPVTWLPKSLAWQFNRVANVYFLFIAVIVCFPFSPKSWKSKVFPFGGVLLWTALKDLFEDLNRRRDDQTENSREFQRYDSQSKRFVATPWRSAQVGELVLVSKDELLPTDILILRSSDPLGVCFLSTVSLDGETNLKERRAATCSQAMGAGISDPAQVADALSGANLEVLLEMPHPNLGEMNGSIGTGGEAQGVSVDNFLTRACTLRNTNWIIGMSAYVGQDTKVRLNATNPPTKFSDVQIYLNRCVLGLLSLLFTVCLVFAICSRTKKSDKHFMIVFLKYCIALYHVVPISLYVMFEVLKLIHGKWINDDPLMVDPDTKAHAQARTADLVEEMGQVGFVFSDKTGTLTANEMRFAFAHYGGRTVGPFLPTSSGEPEAIKEVKQLLQGYPVKQSRQAAQDFFTLLAVCHGVQLDDDGKYQAASPDEVALAEAARSVGLVFSGREVVGGACRAHVECPALGTKASYLIPQVLEFDSDRKRMSVVCANDDGSAVVYTKGADAVMTELLEAPGVPSSAQSALEDFSRRGLRTLVCASRGLSPAEYAAWTKEWDEASRALEGRAQLVAAVSAKVEQRLNFVGITAVEDKLQDGVPETIAALRGEAGLRVWVLTGDKVETAVEIAKSVQLFDKSMMTFFITGKSSSKDAIDTLRNAGIELEKARRERKNVDCGLVLDGQTVRHILEDDEAGRALYEMGVVSQACVCCRLSPAQKKQLVQLVRSQDPKVITLAIGDGANDVPMIQGAHIGVGIRGKEGMGAVQAADIAISQFRFLKNLLLCHGRLAYRHVTLFLVYYLYKNIALAWGDIVHAIDVDFTGNIAYPDWLSSMFNALFTSWPVVVVLAFDKDLPDELSLKTPSLYKFGPQRKGFNVVVLSTWLFLAMAHGIIAWALPVYVIAPNWLDRFLATPEFWKGSATAFTMVIEIVTFKLAIHASRPISRLGGLALVLSLLVYISCMFVLGTMTKQTIYKVPEKVFSEIKSLLFVFLVPPLLLTPDFLFTLLVGRRYLDAAYADPKKTANPKTIDTE